MLSICQAGKTHQSNANEKAPVRYGGFFRLQALQAPSGVWQWPLTAGRPNATTIS